jgi:uncharacterized repeat protein (TIGR03803 family)
MRRAILIGLCLYFVGCGSHPSNELPEAFRASTETPKAGAKEPTPRAASPQPRFTKFTLLHEFKDIPDGALDNQPYGDLTLVNSTLYGITPGGGSGQGTVFCIDTDGRNYRILHYFGGEHDGNGPSRGTLAYDGNALYGITRAHFADQRGAVFRIMPNGSGYRLLHEFGGEQESSIVVSGGRLTLSGSTAYGTSGLGGATARGDRQCLGTLYRMDLDGSNVKILHEFLGGADGAEPTGELTLVGTNLYGMTSFGGKMSWGTIYRIGTSGDGYEVLHEFQNGPNDGSRPLGGLTLVDNRLYGMTQVGGGIGKYDGLVFGIDLDGKNFNIIHKFDRGRGAPEGSLVARGSTLYGATCRGGGAIFKVSTDGTAYSELYRFPMRSKCQPRLTLVGDNLYGVSKGGSKGQGQIFVLPISSATETRRSGE